MKRAIVSVINDLSTDQRVHKHCVLLQKQGYDVLLIGRQMSNSSVLEQRDYKTYRMRLPFEKGPLFYASFNIGLLYHLLLRKADLFFSNDLDTLLPNFLTSRIRGTQLIYDSHEYFTEVPELVNRPFVQSVWKKLEALILPKLKYALTVNKSIAKLYLDDFGIRMKVVRNIPQAKQLTDERTTKTALGLPEDKKLIILQGSGINIDRGAEEAVEAMKYIDDAILLILGSGDIIGNLKKAVEEFGITDKVVFKDRMPYEQMMAHTRLADLGLTLDKDTNINYRFSLPNKLFDYIHARIPVLASNLVEVKSIVDEYKVGDIIYSHNPKVLAAKMDKMLNSAKIQEWKQNCIRASLVLNWETESKVVTSMLEEING